MAKSKSDREHDKRFRAVARKKDVQELYVKLRALLAERNKELTDEKARMEASYAAMAARHTEIFQPAIRLIQNCEQRILDYSYALDNMTPPFNGQGLPSSELIIEAQKMVRALEVSLFVATPKLTVVTDTAEDLPQWVDDTDSEDTDDLPDPFDSSLDDI